MSVQVAEGLILAADSAASLVGTINVGPESDRPQLPGIVQTYEFANKVTQILELPIGVLTWGGNALQDRTIQSLILEFEHEDHDIDGSSTVRYVADQLIAFIKERYDATPEGERPETGLLIGGYSPNEFFPEQWLYVFPTSTELEPVRPPKEDGRPSFGSNWFGLVDALVRLIKGYDSESLEKLIQSGADPEIVQKWVNDGVSELPIVFDGMPLQDAIDFADYVIQVVIGRYRFAVGAPLCGGPIDIAVIRPSGLEWARRKKW